MTVRIFCFLFPTNTSTTEERAEMDTLASNSPVNQRKRKGEDLDREISIIKRPKIADQVLATDLELLELPNDVIRQIALFSESMTVLLLLFTSKRVYKLLNNDNRVWHVRYVNESRQNYYYRRDTMVDMINEDALYTRRETEALTSDWEYPLTEDCLDVANDIIKEDADHYEESVQFIGKYELISYGKLKSFIKYSDLVDYKKLALKSWKQFYQYDFWNIQEKCTRLWKYKHCTCFTLPDLEMTNEYGDKIAIEDTKDDAFSSYSSDDDENDISDGDEDLPNQNSALSEDRCSSFIEQISVIHEWNFKLFVQLLSGVIIGHCASPGCKHSYQLRIAKMFNKQVNIVGDITEDNLEQIRTAMSNDCCFECMSSIVCALQKFSMADLLTLQDCVKQKFPYLATMASVLDIEENIPYFWITWMEYDTAHWAFHIQPDLATVDDHNNMPDWLSIRHSMLKLMRRSGIFMATPNTSEYAVDALSSFIRRVLEAAIELKHDSANHLDVTATTIMQAVKAISKDKDYSTTTLYSTRTDTMQDDLIVMHLDSEISSDDSDFDDPSEENDLNENLRKKVTDDEDENIDKDYEGLNELIKKSDPIMNFDDDDTPLLMKTAVTYAQLDQPYGEMSDIIGVESDSEEDQDYYSTANQAEQFENINVASPEYLEDVLNCHNDNLNIHRKEESTHYKYHSEDLSPDFDLDLPLNELSDEQRAKIMALRRETNKILKEETAKELKKSQLSALTRLNDNFEQYYDNRPDPFTCKSMEIKLNSTGATLQNTITDAINIISNSKELKLVRLKWIWLEEWEKAPHEELYDSLLEALSKCSTLKTVELDECYLDHKIIHERLPNVTVKLLDINK